LRDQLLAELLLRVEINRLGGGELRQRRNEHQSDARAALHLLASRFALLASLRAGNPQEKAGAMKMKPPKSGVGRPSGSQSEISLCVHRPHILLPRAEERIVCFTAA
jgi:hypothetical protein